MSGLSIVILHTTPTQKGLTLLDGLIKMGQLEMIYEPFHLGLDDGCVLANISPMGTFSYLSIYRLIE